MPKRLWNKDGLRRLSGRLLARYVRLVYATSRVVAEPPDVSAALRENAPQIIAMWHGQFLLVPIVAPQSGSPTRAMVARHGDGDLVGELLTSFGIEMIRGAGAGDRKRDRGGAAALRGALRALAEGDNVAMTADIPPGPARKSGIGIVVLAKMSGRPIRPCAVASSRYHAFDTWSRMTLNLPLSRIGVAVGEPITVARDADEATMAAALVQVENELNRVTQRAYELASADPTRATPPHALPPGTPPVPISTRLKLYRIASRAIAPFAPAILKRRLKRGKEDPERLTERLGEPSRPRPDGTVLWFHAASVGETNAALPVIRDIATQRPEIHILLTTGTRTSAQLADARLDGAAVHQFVPVDTLEAVSRFLDHWRPDVAVFTESEIWPNLIIETDRRDVPIILMNARMSPKSYQRWRRRKRFSRPLFSRLRLVLAQNQRLARQFATIGARDIRAIGNLKIDAPALPVDQDELRRLQAQIAGRPILLAASTHGNEEETVLAARATISREIPGLLTLIAPRHPDRGNEISDLAKGAGLTVARRSANEPITPQTDVYIADTIGELGLFYSLAKVAFIGGSLVPRGGQNPIEPVRLSCAVITGPHWDNFPDSYEALLRAEGAISVRSADELAAAAVRLLTNEIDLHRQLQAAEDSIENLSGAQARTVAAITEFLPPKEGLKRAS